MMGGERYESSEHEFFAYWSPDGEPFEVTPVDDSSEAAEAAEAVRAAVTQLALCAAATGSSAAAGLVSDARRQAVEVAKRRARAELLGEQRSTPVVSFSEAQERMGRGNLHPSLGELSPAGVWDATPGDPIADLKRAVHDRSRLPQPTHISVAQGEQMLEQTRSFNDDEPLALAERLAEHGSKRAQRWLARRRDELTLRRRPNRRQRRAMRARARRRR